MRAEDFSEKDINLIREMCMSARGDATIHLMEREQKTNPDVRSLLAEFADLKIRESNVLRKILVSMGERGVGPAHEIRDFRIVAVE